MTNTPDLDPQSLKERVEQCKDDIDALNELKESNI